MDLNIFWSILISIALPSTILFCSKNYLIAKIKATVEHDFNSKLENLKSELRSKESEIAALRDTVLTGRNQRQALVDKRKIEAVDNIWKGVVELQRFKALSNAMASIKFEVAAAEAPKDPKVRMFFEAINKLAPKVETLQPSTAANERPFISPVAWAYFSALQIILYGSFVRAKILEMGVDNAEKFIKTDYEKKLLNAALPHQQENINKFDATAYFYFIEELEDNLLKELTNILDGKASDQESIKRAAEIQKEVDKINAERSQVST